MIGGILIEGLIYALMVLGVFITFRILDFPDLTVDGSFPLGAAIMGIMITSGQNLVLALIISFIGGVIAGMITALIHNKLKVPNLLAGILTMTMLYSINIRVMNNRSNISLLRSESVLTKLVSAFSFIPEEIALLIFFIVFVFLVKMLLDIFFHTDLGLVLRAMGNNQQMIVNQGINPENIKMIGVGLSNGLVALSGAFAAQYQKFADVSLGQGIVVSGLASVMIGEVLMPSKKLSVITLRAIVGSIVYKAVMYYGREYGYMIGMTPNDLKLITGLLIIISLFLTRFSNFKNYFRKNTQAG